MAIEGKIDFVKKTNPFGEETDPEEEFDKNHVEDPAIAARQLMSFVERRQNDASRRGKKPGKETRKTRKVKEA